MKTKIKTVKAKPVWPKLPTKFKARWIAALRSGKYKQGDGRLYSAEDDTYCCLGVASRIAGNTCKTMRDHGNLDSDALARGVPKALCIIGDNRHSRLVNQLVAMNDGTDGFVKHSFSRIATWIEKNL
jgi:hypothetical protein